MSSPVLPTIDDLNRPFWDSCKQGKLVLQRCQRGHLRYPIAITCPRCLIDSFTWEPMSGTGVVHSFVVFRHAYNDAWADRVPYVVALVRLDEGPTMISDLIDVAPDEVRVGSRVSVAFDGSAEITVPRFTIVAERG